MKKPYKNEQQKYCILGLMRQQTSMLLFKTIPAMVYSGLLTGIILEVVLPKTENINGTGIGRRHFIFGGICLATCIAYYRER